MGVVGKYGGLEEAMFNAIHGLSSRSPNVVPLFAEFLSRDNIYQQLSSFESEINKYLISAMASKIDDNMSFLNKSRDEAMDEAVQLQNLLFAELLDIPNLDRFW